MHVICPLSLLDVAGFVPEELQTWEEGPGIPDVPYENRWYRTQCLIHREVVPWAVPWNKVGRHCLRCAVMAYLRSLRCAQGEGKGAG